MSDFMNFVNGKYDYDLKDYFDLYRWSVENIPEFWEAFWEYSGIIFSKDYEEVVDNIKKMPGARWFSGARLNFAENLLSRRDDKTAIIFRGEAEVKSRI
ncbi:MAG: acetoacetate--CoA ligase, partial [Bacteroidetes bacterium]|nr:acetoacetate--CoA ligase [Bacteroidota bacterium]